MSVSSDRGLAFERLVRKMTARALKLDIKRDLQSGAGIHKQDIRDRFNELPIFIECKDHQTIKPKEWWRDANAKSSYGQAPVVVFPDNEEVLCVMRYTDLLNLIKEGRDWRETLDSYRFEPGGAVVTGEEGAEILTKGGFFCKAGHLAIDKHGHCQTKDCIYSRGYVKKIKAKGGFNNGR